jgi:hypothetical protein
VADLCRAIWLRRRRPVKPNVYFAGPVDYIEHRSHGEHVVSNWRHRVFGALDINLLCPTCLNVQSKDDTEIMNTNETAMRIARLFVGYFPGEPTFGTPIETWQFATRRNAAAVLIHPPMPGVFVRTLRDQYGLTVVRSFEEARSWVEHKIGVYSRDRA